MTLPYFVAMSRPRSSRFFRLMLGVLLVFVVGEPGIVDACPIHGNIALLTGRAVPQGGGHQVAAHKGTPAGAHHEHNGSCSCLGLCTSGALAVVLPSPAITPVAVEVTSTESLRFFVEVRWHTAPPHARPFATGPPAA